MERYILGFLGLLLLASFGAFFTYTPVLSALAASGVVAGLIAMFLLGIRIGLDSSRKKTDDKPDEFSAV